MERPLTQLQADALRCLRDHADSTPMIRSTRPKWWSGEREVKLAVAWCYVPLTVARRGSRGSVEVSLATATGLRKRGLLEVHPKLRNYFRITDAGRAAITGASR